MQKNILNNAMAELHLVTQREFSTAQSKRIDWGLIDSKIETMNLALEADDGVSFERICSELVADLRLRNETTREFGREAEDPKQLAPEDTRELLNHLVDQIIGKINEPQSSGENPSKPNRKVET